MSSCIYDVVVIGGGATGCSVARELSRYHLTPVLLERGGGRMLRNFQKPTAPSSMPDMMRPTVP